MRVPPEAVPSFSGSCVLESSDLAVVPDDGLGAPPRDIVAWDSMPVYFGNLGNELLRTFRHGRMRRGRQRRVRVVQYSVNQPLN
jgi:hypothetical protein